MNLKPLILIIDDEEASRYTVRKILERQGYRVLEAEGARDGLEIARQHQPDLVLLDVVMPEMDGNQAIEIIRADPQLKDLYVVHLSAQVAPVEQKMRGLRLGADGYLAQPIESAELLARIEAYLRHKSALTELRASEERYRQLFEGNPQPMWIYDRLTKNMLSANAAALKKFGATQEAFLALKPDTMLEPFPLEPNEPPSPTQNYRYCAEGVDLEFETLTQEISWNKTPAMAVLAIDVTERNRAEREKRLRLERFLRELDSLSFVNTGDASHAQPVGTPPVESFRMRNLNEFARLVGEYVALLESEYDQRVYAGEPARPGRVTRMADDLYAHGATGRDVIELHYTALRKLAPTPDAPKAQGYMEVGRLTILETLSHLLFRYRLVARKALGLRQLSQTQS